ncbi:hypothetical protein QR97_38135 [Streptomyces sp. PBH53]|nr:hypothetical protein QR97_38135 [Streptomyces sp. PBH53]
MAQPLHGAGRAREALDRLRRAPGAGDPYDWNQFADLLEPAGRSEKARRLRRYGREPDGTVSELWSAAPPYRPPGPPVRLRTGRPGAGARRPRAGWGHAGGPAMRRVAAADTGAGSAVPVASVHQSLPSSA